MTTLHVCLVPAGVAVGDVACCRSCGKLWWNTGGENWSETRPETYDTTSDVDRPER